MKHTYNPDILALNPALRDVDRVSKYHNVPTEIDGHRFASRKEAADYFGLELLERAGLITNLRLQPRFVLQAAFTDSTGAHHRATEYVADFQWDDTQTGRTHVRDTKGYTKNAVWRLKEKMFRKLYPQYIFEVG